MDTFQEVWQEFNVKILAYIESKVGNKHDAEDILQVVFMKVFKNINQLEDPKAIKPWLYTISKHSIIDFYKKKKDLIIGPDDLYKIEEDGQEMDNMNDDIAACFENMIFELPYKYQAVYDMYEKEDLKHKDIAQNLNISVSTSKVRLMRAKALFKEKLLECCDFQVDSYGNIIDYTPKITCKKKCSPLK